LSNGLLLINLMEIISGKSLGRYNKHPKIIQQKMENLNIALNFIKSEGIQLVNVGSDDIQSGNIRIILGLIWTLILRYEINRGNSGDSNGANDLLRWIQSKIPEYNIKGFKKDWNDGRAVCALCDACRPGSFPDHKSLDPNNKMDNATRGIDVADSIGVDKLILPEEMTNPKVDKLAMMTYLAQFRNLPDTWNDHTRCRAYGPGLVEGVVNTPGEFIVEKPVPGNLEVKVEGPVDDAKVEVKETEPGKYDVAYHPTTPGHYKVHVTLDGNHIPGSIFHVQVLDEISLGGEGKIRVFYSTTSSNQQYKNDFRKLQSMFQGKKVHLRDDFEPWIAVDIMDRDDRNQVFDKAGTRKLPIVFIDDKYRGGWEEMMELEEHGKLDDLLNMRSVNLVSEEDHMKRLKNMSAEGNVAEIKEEMSGNSGAASAAPATATATTSAPASSAGTKFCGNCGAPRATATTKFCGECGGKF